MSLCARKGTPTLEHAWVLKNANNESVLKRRVGLGGDYHFTHSHSADKSAQAMPRLRHILDEFLEIGFAALPTDETRPFCVICKKSFLNRHMRKDKLEKHFRQRHQGHIQSRKYFLDIMKAFTDAVLPPKRKEYDLFG